MYNGSMMHDVPYKKDDFMTEDYKGLSGSESQPES